MSGTEPKRPDLPQVGLSESAQVRGLLVDDDGGAWAVEKERACLRKFDGDWTAEQMANGEAEAAGALAEVIVVEDGEIVTNSPGATPLPWAWGNRHRSSSWWRAPTPRRWPSRRPARSWSA